MNFRFFPLAVLVFGAAVLISSLVSAQHFDVFVSRPAAGTQTVYGGIDVDTADVTLFQRVFEAEMGEDPFDGTFTSDEPGFNHPADDAGIPAGAVSLVAGDEVFVMPRSLAVDGVTSNLFFWNGTGDVAFAPAVGASFAIDTGNLTGSIGTAGAGGAFDDHPFFVLDDGDASPATFPTAGIYLASFLTRVADLGPSDPLFLVMGTEGLITPEFLGISQEQFNMLTEAELDEALEEVIEVAVSYVETNVVPEPSSLVAALSVYGVAMAIRRKRTT
jgi:hypothetical protein